MTINASGQSQRPLTAAQKAVLSSIKDNSTPPYKGMILDNIISKLTDNGLLIFDATDRKTKLTIKGYEALGYDHYSTTKLVAPNGMEKQTETEAERIKRENVIITPSVTSALSPEGLARKAEILEARKPKGRPKVAKAQRPEGSVSVISTTDVELGFYVPYQYERAGGDPFTFYKVWVIVPNEPPIFITENATGEEYAAKRIVQEYNRHNPVKQSRKRVETA